MWMAIHTLLPASYYCAMPGSSGLVFPQDLWENRQWLRFVTRYNLTLQWCHLSVMASQITAKFGYFFRLPSKKTSDPRITGPLWVECSGGQFAFCPYCDCRWPCYQWVHIPWARLTHRSQYWHSSLVLRLVSQSQVRISTEHGINPFHYIEEMYICNT